MPYVSEEIQGLHLFYWAELDLNQRRQSPAELQSAPINHSGIDPLAFLPCKKHFLKKV